MMSTDNYLFIAQGPFGSAVAEVIGRSRANVRVVSFAAATAAVDETFARAGCVGVALSRRFPAEQHAFDAVAARLGIPWSCALLDGRRLQNGPVISPGHGPCFDCWEKRRRSHQVAPDREEALEAAYAKNPELAVRGFLAGHAIMAAAGLLLDLRQHRWAAGRVRIVDLLGGEVEETRALGVHGCARCGGSHRSGDRYTCHLGEELAEVLP